MLLLVASIVLILLISLGILLIVKLPFWVFAVLLAVLIWKKKKI